VESVVVFLVQIMRRVSNIEGSDRHERYRIDMADSAGLRTRQKRVEQPASHVSISRVHHNDPQALAEREWQERRIWQLQELLLTAEVGAQPPDDGVAEPGMVLTVRYADRDDTETVPLANREAHQVHETMKVYSPDSPLGRARLGARQNDTRDYFVPNGGTKSVTLLKAKPFRE
jgi:transcription elongation GreA/GreB family factor